MKKAFLFLAFFHAIDIFYYFGIYFLHSFFVRGYMVSSAVSHSSYWVAGRFFYLQLPIQIIFVGMLYFWGLHTKLALVLLASFIACVIPGLVLLGGFSGIAKLLMIDKLDFGPAFAVLASVSLAFLTFELIKRLQTGIAA